MNFFQSQDKARTNTRRLVIFFMLAVISLIAMTNLLVMLLFGFLDVDSQQQTTTLFSQPFNWQIFFTISAAVITVVLAGSAYKTMALSGGGEVVAESLGGHLIDPSSQDLHERKVLNVVEEMAIASGSPVPAVYLLSNEEGINAFAAGFTTGDAVIGVTKGTIKYLSREELQGVIAHEFSHIIHGDMRLNLRLIAILHGILLLGIIGYFLLRSARGNSKNSGPIIGLGLGLMVIGYAGTFFGNLIKSSVSRQREFLADASAVQFTRNNLGIAGALKKIGGLSAGSLLESPSASSMSHAYFSNGITSYLDTLTATHPPLDIRIKRLEPDWDGQFAEIVQEVDDQAEAAQPNTGNETVKKAMLGAVVGHQILSSDVLSTELVDRIGSTTIEQLNYASSLLNQLPTRLKEATRDPYAARAVIYCLILSADLNIQQQQFDYLRTFSDEGVFDLCEKVFNDMSVLEIKFRLPLVDIALPSLRRLSMKQYDLFKSNLIHLIKIDNKVDIFEWALQKILFNNLDNYFAISNKVRSSSISIKAAKDDIALLLSLLAYANAKNKTQLNEAFKSATALLPLEDLKIADKDLLNVASLGKAADALANLKPLQKPQLLKACLACITYDKNYSAQEKELMRAIAATLDCPLPLYTE